MIDRSYLPFNSAKHYQDPGMQKWMGFFLSEHTALLKDEENKDCFTSELSLVDKMTFVTQLYASQMIGQFTVRKKRPEVRDKWCYQRSSWSVNHNKGRRHALSFIS